VGGGEIVQECPKSKVKLDNRNLIKSMCFRNFVQLSIVSIDIKKEKR